MRNVLLILLLASCTIVPEPTIPVEKYVWDEDGYLIVPSVETLKLVWNTYEWDVTRVDVEIYQGEALIKEFSTSLLIAADTEDPSIPFYQALVELPPGRYEVRIRCMTVGRDDPSDWSDPYKFSKAW